MSCMRGIANVGQQTCCTDYAQPRINWIDEQKRRHEAERGKRDMWPVASNHFGMMLKTIVAARTPQVAWLLT